MSGNPTDSVAEALSEAITRLGGAAKLGAAVGVAHSSVFGWRKEGRVPAKHVLGIEKATGVSRHRLRPDLYPPPASGFAEHQASYVAEPLAMADEARALGLDPDAIAARAIASAVRVEKGRRWIEENREAMEAQNAWVEKHGLPLAKYRLF